MLTNLDESLGSRPWRLEAGLVVEKAMAAGVVEKAMSAEVVEAAMAANVASARSTPALFHKRLQRLATHRRRSFFCCPTNDGNDPSKGNSSPAMFSI